MAHGWVTPAVGIPASDAWDGHRVDADGAPRRRTQTATAVLNLVCSVIAAVSIDPVDRNVLFEQYDFKLMSCHDSLFGFCLSLIPTVLLMGTIFVLFKVVRKLRSLF